MKRRDPARVALRVKAKRKTPADPKHCSKCQKTAWYKVNRTGFCRDHLQDARVAACKANGVDRKWIRTDDVA